MRLCQCTCRPWLQPSQLQQHCTGNRPELSQRTHSRWDAEQSRKSGQAQLCTCSRTAHVAKLRLICRRSIYDQVGCYRRGEPICWTTPLSSALVWRTNTDVADVIVATTRCKSEGTSRPHAFTESSLYASVSATLRKPWDSLQRSSGQCNNEKMPDAHLACYRSLFQ